MDKTSREKFLDIKSGDCIKYIEKGVTCEGFITGWKHVAGEPTPVVGSNGNHAVQLDKIISRTRNGNDTRQWPNSIVTEAKLQATWQEAKDMLAQCEEELLNAQSMGNKPRIAQCRKWREEAAYHEQEARKALTEVK